MSSLFPAPWFLPDLALGDWYIPLLSAKAKYKAHSELVLQGWVSLQSDKTQETHTHKHTQTVFETQLKHSPRGCEILSPSFSPGAAICTAVSNKGAGLVGRMGHRASLL